MIFYVMDKKSFKPKFMGFSENYSLVIGSNGSDTSSITLPYTTTIGKGDYISNLDDFIGIIKTISIKDGALSLTAIAMDNLFDRSIMDDDIRPSASLEGYIAGRITRYFAAYEDSFYNYPFLVVSNSTNTEIESAPDLDNNGCYNLKKYIEKCRRLYGIKLSWKINGDKLHLDIHKDESKKNLILDGFSYALTDNVESETKVAKITAIKKATEETAAESIDYYLLSDGTISTNINDPKRVEGSWQIITYTDKDIPLEKASEKFASNEYNHKITFTSVKADARFNPFDKVVIQLNGNIYDSYISKMIVKSNGVINYECGELALTLTDKLNKRG